MSDKNSSWSFVVWYYISLIFGFLVATIPMLLQSGWHMVIRKKQDSIEPENIEKGRSANARTHEQEKHLVGGSLARQIANGGRCIISNSRQAFSSAAEYALSYVPPSVENTLRNLITVNEIVVDSKFTIYIHEGELENIRRWVKKHDSIETGGDLFGLWIDKYNLVVQIVLGPGKNCNRTEYSFFQDVDYLRDCGEELTQKHGLCNTGQWHSHHRLGLLQPSSGDENTVWNNMPVLNFQRFVVCIATISDQNKVNVKPFLFEIENGNQLPIVEGKFQLLPGISPLRGNEIISEKLKRHAESMNNILDI